MPAPSLGMIMKMCVSMETWLGDNDENVVVVHCLVSAFSLDYPSDWKRSYINSLCLSISMVRLGREL